MSVVTFATVIESKCRKGDLVLLDLTVADCSYRIMRAAFSLASTDSGHEKSARLPRCRCGNATQWCVTNLSSLGHR